MAFVETDFGEVFRVMRPDGSTGGKALLSFLTIAISGCRKDNSVEQALVDWINNFNENSENDFCSAIKKLRQVYYSGSWDYQDDEYDLYMHRFPGSSMSEVDFQRTIKEVREMWTDIQSIIDTTKTLVGEFRKGYLKETDWYVGHDTIGDFEGLLNTLHLAKDRATKEVRIRID